MVDLNNIDLDSIKFSPLTISNFVYSNISSIDFTIRMKVIYIDEHFLHLQFLPHQTAEYEKIKNIENYIVNYFSSKCTDILATGISKSTMESIYKSIINPPLELGDLPFIKVLYFDPITQPLPSIITINIIFQSIRFTKLYYNIIAIAKEIAPPTTSTETDQSIESDT